MSGAPVIPAPTRRMKIASHMAVGNHRSKFHAVGDNTVHANPNGAILFINLEESTRMTLPERG